MRVNGRSMLLGAAAAVATRIAAGALLLGLGGPGLKEQSHRMLRLPSGRALEVTALYLGFGDAHSGRGAGDDGLSVEYVASSTDDEARAREAGEVFEAIRPLAESLGVRSASVSAFPTLVRKGRYERHDYTRDESGAWTSKRTEAKVFATD
jgi:hypothetical protein